MTPHLNISQTTPSRIGLNSAEEEVSGRRRCCRNHTVGDLQPWDVSGLWQKEKRDGRTTQWFLMFLLGDDKKTFHWPEQVVWPRVTSVGQEGLLLFQGEAVNTWNKTRTCQRARSIIHSFIDSFTHFIYLFGCVGS